MFSLKQVERYHVIQHYILSVAFWSSTSGKTQRRNLLKFGEAVSSLLDKAFSRALSKSKVCFIIFIWLILTTSSRRGAMS